jgi:pimeloyl-ACP methyl ester carboxylesterase
VPDGAEAGRRGYGLSVSVFVLVHGGWGGGWEWAAVSRQLAVAENEAYRPTLTGCGERSHLISAAVDLDTHIEDVLGALWCEDLRDVILVGQSSGGSVVTGVADRAPERVRRVVYVEGFVLRDGEAMVDVLPAAFVAGLRESAIDGYRVPLPFSAAELEIGGAVGGWYAERLRFHPLGAFEQPLRLTGAVDRLPRTYVRCAGNVELEHHFTGFVERALDEGWDYRVIDAPHDAHVAAPETLARLLCDVARI